MSDKRINKLTSLLTREIAQIINREIKDPRLKGMVSITNLELAKDLKTAVVHVSVFSLDNIDARRHEDIEVLNNASRYIMFLLSKRIYIKYIPNLYFKIDKSLEKVAKVNEILEDIRKEHHDSPETARDAAAGADAARQSGQPNQEDISRENPTGGPASYVSAAHAGSETEPEAVKPRKKPRTAGSSRKAKTDKKASKTSGKGKNTRKKKSSPVKKVKSVPGRKKRKPVKVRKSGV
jgi:ribosome-binding factor A